MVAITVPSILILFLIIGGIFYFSNQKKEKETQKEQIQELINALTPQKEKEKEIIPEKFEGSVVLTYFDKDENGISVYQYDYKRSDLSSSNFFSELRKVKTKEDFKKPYITFYEDDLIYDELSKYLTTYEDDKAIWYEVKVSITGTKPVYDDNYKKIIEGTIDKDNIKIIEATRYDSSEIKKNIEEELRTKYKDRYIESVV